MDARALGTALALAFQRAGGQLRTNEAVVRIEHQDGRAAVAHTPFGLYHADVFVLAAGAWSGLIEADIAPITPVKGEMIALAPPQGEKRRRPGDLGQRHLCRAARRTLADRRHRGKCGLRHQPDRRGPRSGCAAEAEI